MKLQSLSVLAIPVLAAAFLAAAPAISSAQSNLTVSVTPTVALDDAYFVYIYNNGSGDNAGYAFLGSLLPAVQKTSVSFDSPALPNDILEYSLASLYGGGLAGGGGVLVALPAVQANAAVGKSWDTFFDTGPNSPNTEFNEAAIDTSLLNANPTLLFQFEAYTGAADAVPFGATGDLVSFTNGALAGTINVASAPVPEPASLSLAAIASATLMTRRRKALLS